MYALTESDVGTLRQLVSWWRRQGAALVSPRRNARTVTPLRRFWAKITGSAGAAHAWTEQQSTGYSVGSGPGWQDKDGGLSGTTAVDPAYALDGTPSVPDDTIVVMYQLVTSAGEILYLFDPRGAAGFWARITAGAADGEGATNRWVYTFEEAEKAGAGYGGWGELSGGRTGDAYNSLENMNSAAGVQGNGVDVANLDTDDFTFAIQRAPNGAVVWMRAVPRNGSTEYWFQYANGVDGSCD